MVPQTHLSLHVCICSPGFHLVSPSMFCAQPLSRVWLFVALWTVVRQAPLSMGFPRQEYWSGVPFLFPEDLPNPGIEPASPVSPALQTDTLLSHQGSPQIMSTFV